MPVDSYGTAGSPSGAATFGIVAKVTEKRPDGSAVLIAPPGEAAGLEVGASVEVRPSGAVVADAMPWPFGALAGKYPPFEIEEIKAARREALLGKLK
jgi:hypothetical protein